MTGGTALTLTGSDQLAKVLAEMGPAADQAVANTLTAFGTEVVKLAATGAPGSLKTALDSVYYPTNKRLEVTAGSALKPAAYVMHATALGYSRGYMTFHVPAHTRRGSAVSAYKTVRRVPNNPYLLRAWAAYLPQLTNKLMAALAPVVNGG